MGGWVRVEGENDESVVVVCHASLASSTYLRSRARSELFTCFGRRQATHETHPKDTFWGISCDHRGAESRAV